MKYVLPVMFILIIAYALFKKVRPYDAFVSGAGQAIPFAIKLFPYLAAIFVLTELFEESGAADAVSAFLAPAFRLLGIPPELSKLVLVKPFSGNGALALLTEIYETYGVDSYIARCASVIYGSSLRMLPSILAMLWRICQRCSSCRSFRFRSQYFWKSCSILILTSIRFR